MIEKRANAIPRTPGYHGYHGPIGVTTHVSVFPDNIPGRIVEWVTLLQGHLAATGLNYQLWTGGEVRIADDTISWLEKHGVPTIGSSRHVLVDYWGNIRELNRLPSRVAPDLN